MGKGKRLRAERERRHEEHVRIKIQRAGDRNYAQRQVTEHGVEYTLPPDMAAALQEQAERFRQRFGREMGPDDPVFFDPDMDVPTPLSEAKINSEFRKAIIGSGADPAFADAYEELGYLVTEMNRHTFTAHEVDAWDDAVERSRRRARSAQAEAPPDEDDADT